MYCGNNRNNKTGKKIGNKYDCLRQGIGVGLNLPVDKNYKGKFIPIDPRKIYCGRSNSLPQGYDIIGNNFICLQKGVGIGKQLKAKRKNEK